jgi:hypothetical protein
MSYSRDKSGGVLFIEEKKKSQNAPDFTGEVEFLREEVMHLVEALKAGNEAKLRIAGWKKVSAKGKKFISLSLEIPRSSEGGGQKKETPSDGWGDDDNDLDDEIPFN